MSDSDSEKDNEDKTHTIASDIVVTKYNMAADIVNAVLKELVQMSVTSKAIVELCEYGDQQIVARTSKVFKKEKDMRKGIAFPTCVSVNNCVCHFSPLRSESETALLKDGDLVKIDMGAHVDGFIATCAHSFVIGATVDNKVSGRKSDVILAAHQCLEASIRMLKPGVYKSYEVTDMIQKICDDYNTKPIENMLSFKLDRFQIGNEEDPDGKQIIQNPSDDQKSKIKKHDFDQHEVWALDILISSGEGKTRDRDTRTTVYKRKDIVYQLKMKASRMFFSEADKKFGTMPFSLRSFDDEKKAKMGIVECERHELMRPFKVYYERDGEFVAQFKSTVLIMPSGLLKITGLPFDDSLYESEHKLENELAKKLIISSLKPSKNKKGKKKVAATDEALAAAKSLGADVTPSVNGAAPAAEPQKA